MGTLFNSSIERIKLGQKIFRILVCTLFLFILLYGYFVSTSIINVLVRKEVEQSITDVNSRLSELETHYLVLKNQITLEYAYTRGFVDITDKQFTVRAAAAGLSLRDTAALSGE